MTACGLSLVTTPSMGEHTVRHPVPAFGIGSHDDLHCITDDHNVEGSSGTQRGLVDEVGVRRVQANTSDARFEVGDILPAAQGLDDGRCGAHSVLLWRMRLVSHIWYRGACGGGTKQASTRITL